jgi:hypothetical protein
MAAALKIALYVSSVKGRLVSRPGSPHSYIGARTRSPEEIQAGVTEPVWDTEAVVPVLEAEYDKYRREWDARVRVAELEKQKAAATAPAEGADGKPAKGSK